MKLNKQTMDNGVYLTFERGKYSAMRVNTNDHKDGSPNEYPIGVIGSDERYAWKDLEKWETKGLVVVGKIVGERMSQRLVEYLEGEA